MRVALMTVGDPERISGGYLYQERVAARAAGCGASMTVVSVPERRFPFALLAARRALRAAATAGDVVVVDSLASSAVAPWLVVRPPRRALVGSVHQRPGGTDAPRWWRAIVRRLDLAVYRRCRRVVVPSALLADQLVAAGIDAGSIRVVVPGCDIPERGPTPPVGRARDAGGPIAALCVANWVPRKGILELLDAIAGVEADALVLHLVGDEHADEGYGRAVIDRLERGDLEGRVVRHGVIAPADMPALYAAADVFVLPSREEPYGMVYAEAMDAGLPVVGWDAGNLPNLVDDRVEGRLVPLDDVVALGKALAELARDKDERRALGAAARRRARSLPTWDDAARRFYTACREALLHRDQSGIRIGSTSSIVTDHVT